MILRFKKCILKWFWCMLSFSFFLFCVFLFYLLCKALWDATFKRPEK